MSVFFYPIEKAQPVQFFNHFYAGVITVDACIFSGGSGQVPVQSDDVEDFQAVALANLKVDGVVGGGYLQGAGAEFAINGFITDHRNRLVHDR